MFQPVLLLIALLLAAFSVNAQTEEPPWADQQEELKGSLDIGYPLQSSVLEGESAYTSVPQTMINGIDGTGIIYEFRRDGTRWVEYAQIRPPQHLIGKSNHLHFGELFAINGDQMIVSAPELSLYVNDYMHLDPPPAEMTNRLLHYVRISGVWTYVSEIPNPAPSDRSTFRLQSIVAEGDTLAVGEYYHKYPMYEEPEGYVSGRVHLFHLSAGNWQYETTLYVTTPNTLMCRNTGFGRSIALSADGNTLVGGGGDAQQIWVFRRTDDVWHFQQVIDASELKWCSEFGFDVDISPDGQTIVAANPSDKAVDVFDYDGAQWQFTQRVTSTPPPDGYSSFGRTFDFDGESIIVQSFRNIDTSLERPKFRGPAVVFRKVDGMWIQHGNLFAFEIDEFNEPVVAGAQDVKIRGEYALITAFYRDYYRTSVFAFKIPGIQQDLPETIASRNLLSVPPAPRSETPVHTTFEVSLKTRPSRKVQLKLKTNGSVLLDTGATASATLVLTFNRKNWNQPQTVRARAAAHVMGAATSVIKEKFSVESAAEYRWLTPKQVVVTVAADNFGAISPDNGAALPIDQSAVVFSWHSYELATRYVLKVKNGKGIVSKIPVIPADVCAGDICTLTVDASLLPTGKTLSWRVKAIDKPAAFAQATDWRTLTRVQ